MRPLATMMFGQGVESAGRYPEDDVRHHHDRRTNSGVDACVPGLRRREGGIDAHRCMCVLLRMHGLSRTAPSQGRRLLRVLLVRLREMPAEANRTSLRMYLNA